MYKYMCMCVFVFVCFMVFRVSTSAWGIEMSACMAVAVTMSNAYETWMLGRFTFGKASRMFFSAEQAAQGNLTCLR